MTVEMRGAVGSITTKVVLPTCCSTVATTVASPPVTPRTTPLGLTVAMPGVSEFHWTTRPASGTPPGPLGVAVIWRVAPMSTSAASGRTSTLTTRAGRTVTMIVSIVPSTTAETSTVPSLTPVTTPAVLTSATDALTDVHVTPRPFSVLPAWSLGVALIVMDSPTRRVAGSGTMTMSATPAGPVGPPSPPHASSRQPSAAPHVRCRAPVCITSLCGSFVDGSRPLTLDPSILSKATASGRPDSHPRSTGDSVRSSDRADQLRSAVQASRSHPTRSATPPMGVTAPSHRGPVRTSR